jgi:hypothetical protein
MVNRIDAEEPSTNIQGSSPTPSTVLGNDKQMSYTAVILALRERADALGGLYAVIKLVSKYM